jgi:phosphoribosyl 1,2-cyclic phosphodiesterase
LDAVLITHGHADACGGIPLLADFLKVQKLDRIPVYTLPRTIAIIKKRFVDTDRLEIHAIEPFHSFSILDAKITPLPVDHSIQPGFPTLGFFVDTEQTSFVYMSDVAAWSKKVEGYMRRADTLIIDGAMWDVPMKAHQTIQKLLSNICPWENKHIILTQIGNTAPPIEELTREVKALCPKAIPAYDGMRIEFLTLTNPPY